MQHPLIEFVTVTAPKRCGVHPAFGRVAEMVLYQEALGDPVFSAIEFKTTRERAALALPFNPGLSEDEQFEYERCLDVVELAMLKHAERSHGAEPSQRTRELEEDLTRPEDMAVIQSDWWVG